MSRRRHRSWNRRLGHALEYAAIRTAFACFGRLPVSFLAPPARLLAALVTRCLPIRREVLQSNLAQALGPLDPSRRRDLLRQVHYHSILLGMESARLGRLSRRAIMDAVAADPEACRALFDHAASGAPAVLATGHFGNWEWGAAWAAQVFAGRVGFIYKPLHNPLTDRFVRARRAHSGLERLFSTRERTPREMIAHMRSSGVVAMLIDQDAGRRGVFVPFFGRPASTAPGLATFALRAGAPIFFIACRRESPCRFSISVEGPLHPDPAAPRADEEVRLLTAYHQWLERVIRRDPPQYFWWHRRWKSRPPGSD